MKTTIKTTCPRDCYDACGIVAIVRDGRVSKVLGDPQHGRAQGSLCAKCALAYNGVWLDETQRLLRPLRRVGPKGDGNFEAVTWEEAVADIASRLGRILQDSGAHTVLHTHYTGTCSLIAGNFPSRFFHRLGATEVDPDTVCNKAGHDALRHMFGNSFYGFDPRTAAETDCLIVWGANPSASAPHVHKHWLPEVKKRAKLIVVDPIRHESADLADLHLQLRPGTDALLAFALLNVLQRDGLLDTTFIARSVMGWEAIAADIARADPNWAAAQTGVPAADIEQAAHWYGAGRSLLWIGQGVQRQALGGNVMRSVALLPTATGNLGRLGSGVLYMNAPPARGIDMDWLSGVALRPQSQAPLTVSHMDLAATLEDQSRSRALFTWNNNIAASSPEQRRLRDVLRREELFHVAVDVFPTDTTSYADYVLPAASFLEFDDLLLSYFDYTVSAQVKAMEPMGQSLPNQEIFRRLADEMQLQGEALYEDDAQMIDAMLQQIDLPITFEQLAKVGTVPWRDQCVNHFDGGVFPTPSGKVDVASPTWSALGMPLSPQARADGELGVGRLRVLSPADKWLMNSSYANDARIAARIGVQTVWIHPEEAARRELRDGQQVCMRNETGQLSVALGLTDRVPLGVALLPKGRWPSRDSAQGNVNVLNPGQKSDLGESSAVHSIEVELVAA